MKRLVISLILALCSTRAIAQSVEEAYPIVSSSDHGNSVGVQIRSLTYHLQKDKGLQVIDSSTPESPVILSQLDLPGIPQALIYTGNPIAVYAVMNEALPAGPDGGSFGQVHRISISNPKAIRLVNSITVKGFVEQSRGIQRGIYLLTHKSRNDQSENFVQGIGYREGFDQADNWSTNERAYLRQVSQDLVFIASEQGDGSELEYFDISNYTGAVLRYEGKIRIKGRVLPGGLHIDDKTRIVNVISRLGQKTYVQSFWAPEANDLYVETYPEFSFPNLFAAQKLLFSGDKAYFYAEDEALTKAASRSLRPLDLKDPKRPKLLKALDIPGWVMDIKIIDNRLIGIGKLVGTEPQLQLAVFDSGSSPLKEMSRLPFGAGSDWQWTKIFSNRSLQLLSKQSQLLAPFAQSGNSAGDRPALLFDLDLQKGQVSARRPLNLTNTSLNGQDLNVFPINNSLGSVSPDELRIFTVDSDKAAAISLDL